jgi:hypothetical protein
MAEAHKCAYCEKESDEWCETCNGCPVCCESEEHCLICGQSLIMCVATYCAHNNLRNAERN